MIFFANFFIDWLYYLSIMSIYLFLYLTIYLCIDVYIHLCIPSIFFSFLWKKKFFKETFFYAMQLSILIFCYRFHFLKTISRGKKSERQRVEHLFLPRKTKLEYVIRIMESAVSTAYMHLLFFYICCFSIWLYKSEHNLI